MHLMVAEFSPVFLRPAYDFLQDDLTKCHKNLTNDSKNYANKYRIYGDNRNGGRLPVDV